MLDRRAFLRDGTRLVAALAVLPSWRRCGNLAVAEFRAGPGEDAGALGPRAGAMCAGSAVPRPSRTPMHPDALARFVDALPIPPTLTSESRPGEAGAAEVHYRIAMRAAEIRVHRDMLPTRMWGYEGLVPGPTIEVRSGETVSIEWANDLPTRHFLPIDHTLHGAHAALPEVRAVVHVHGAKAPPESDGYPEDWYEPGRSAISHYPNRQDAALLWYHDHAMGIERLNQYAGLFGLFVIRDAAEEALDLPRGALEVPLVLCDRLFDADGQLHYPTSGAPDSPWVSEVYGDAHLVNGKLFPHLEVEPRRYRFRVLNASNARFYDLSLSNGEPFHQIGSDQGLLSAPVAVTAVTLGPAERADLVVDFAGAAGQNVVLQSQALPLLQFRVAAAASGRCAPLPAKLRPLPRLSPATAVKTRVLTLNEYVDPKTHRMVMLLNGTYWRQPVTERPIFDSVEIWSLVNLTEDSHPIHLHLVRFQILDRQPFDADEYLTSGAIQMRGKAIQPTAGEAGWKDTVRADPGNVTRIIVRFDGYAGRYVWHCHLLEHAANEMMRPFDVVPL